MKHAKLTAVLKPTEADAVRKAANAADMTVSAYLRRMILKTLKLR